MDNNDTQLNLACAMLFDAAREIGELEHRLYEEDCVLCSPSTPPQYGPKTLLEICTDKLAHDLEREMFQAKDL